MSGEEFEGGIEDEFELEEDEVEDDKELIFYVKANSFLYNKSDKLYSNNQIKKMAWTTIGNNLTTKKTGVEAEHRFFQLRQRFGRERRKVIQSKPRSGAGASDEPTYTPCWNLYNDLIFLTDVIKHRKTSSNYTRKPSSNTSLTLPSSSSSTSHSNWNEELSLILFDDCRYSSMSESSQPSQQPSLAANTSLFSEDNNISPTPKIQKTVLSVASEGIKLKGEKRVSELDIFAKKKKQAGDTFSKSILEQQKVLNVLAQKVGDALSVPASPVPSSFPEIESFTLLRPDVKAMLTSIGFGLQKIPESKLLDFQIAIMQLVKEYIQ